MASTQLQMTNKLLRRLREDQVTATTNNAYSQLIAEFLSDAYEFVLEAALWENLKHTVTVDIIPGTQYYDLTRTVSNGGNVRNTDPRVAKLDSELVWIDKDPSFNIYTSDSAAVPQAIFFLEPDQFRNQEGLLRNTTSADPFYFTLDRDQVSGSNTTRLYLKFYPTTTTARVAQVDLWTKPDLWLSDGTTDNTEIAIPERPVYLYALMMALNERGEELGEPGNIAERNFLAALGVAVEKDLAVAQRGDRFDWRRD